MRSIHFLINFAEVESKHEQSRHDIDQFEEETNYYEFKPNKENAFMNCVVKVIFKIAYCYESTREVCHKEGNSLLFAICSAHPQLIGTILNEIDLNLDKIGKKALYLGAELPFHLWLEHLDCVKDMNFIEKCLLSTPTNSILFNLATKCIDNLNLKQNTNRLSNFLIKQWNNQNSFKLTSRISLSHLIQIKLAFVLYELHSRLTIYSYFSQTQSSTPTASMNFMDESFQLEINFSSKLNISSKEELISHYQSKISKEKRLSVLQWIWLTLNRMNLLVSKSMDISTDYLDHLGQAYSNTKQIKLFNNAHLNSLITQFVNNNGQSIASEQSKCPLEKYFHLIFSYSNQLDCLQEPHLVESVQSIISVHNNKPQLMYTAYLLLFNWLESIIFNYATVKLDAVSVQQNISKIEELREFKQENSVRFSSLLLVILNPVASLKVTDNYCAQLNKRLNDFENLSVHLHNKPEFKRQNEENAKQYLSLWIEILISTIKNWHRYKNIVKLIDFLIANSFRKHPNQLIDINLLDEFMSYVRIDFNLIPSSQTVVSGSDQDQPAGTQLKPLNWLESSFSFVTSTASHLTESLINSVNYANNSSDYDSNQPSQFTYDKRLYKEFPYVGLYLSLCEERLETQLSLWSTLRSCLISNETGINTDSSSYIEACWRKTLQSVNKAHNLNLNFSMQRLMLFKWCERALELADDHPLLIIYWQKHFTLYLDKEFSSQPDKPSKSPTMKIFTSTSQLNSMLKQMKKQLELTSQHYAYICHNQKSGAQLAAPSLNYDSNEFMSKLYYALSLWVDETRLHDPNLYLPALPNHYEPDLLAKIYSKQSELWTQFVDANKITSHISSIVSKETTNSHPAQPNQSNGMKHKNETIFFKQDDRMVQSVPSIAQLNVRLQCALKEKFGSSIESLLDVDASAPKDQYQFVLNIAEHLIRNIFNYNKEIINTTLNYMFKLDDKLINKLLTNLWHNELCEKYIQVACTSLLNPMHQCQRPAMIKFVYELATKRDQYRHEIKENRYNYEKLLANFLESKHNSNRFPNDEIIKSMVALNQLVKLMLRNYHQHSSNTGCHVTLTRLFYLLIDLYEGHMLHSNDVINALVNETNAANSARQLDEDWSVLTLSSRKMSDSMSAEQYLTSDSIHLFMFDLINLIGSNFVQIVSHNNSALRKKSQQCLLEKIIQKLTSNTLIQAGTDHLAIIQQSSSNSSSIMRKSNNLLINLTRNKLALMALCAQFVEPNDLDLFNELYNDILCSITSILINANNSLSSIDGRILEFGNSNDKIETINFKLSIISHLLSKFSFYSLNKLLEQNKTSEFNELCTKFVDSNINFLMDLKLDSLADQQPNEDNLRLIIDQCFDNFVSILNVNYPFYFDYILQKCLDFSSRPVSLKYGSKHLVKLNVIIQQNELMQQSQHALMLNREQLENVFKYLTDFYAFEREKYKSQTRSFYNHWFCFIPQLTDIYTNLFLIYLDRFVMKDMIGKAEQANNNLHNWQTNFEKKYDQLWYLLLNLYSVWIDPKSILELTSQSVINVKEIFDSEHVSLFKYSSCLSLKS